jgi:HAD superfamily hydrolase (TIGR01509 family)
MPEIRALVFDFDGLILDTETALIDAYGDTHRAHGVAFDRPLFARSVGHADYAFDPWKAFGLPADRVKLEAERRAFNRSRDVELPVLPGVADLLASARKAGLLLGVASNSGRAHVEGHLRRLGMLASFDRIACREDVRSPKPEPDLYRHAAGLLGVRPNEAVAFEDSHTGTLAAHRAGLWVVAVPNGSTEHHDFSNAHLKVASLADCTLGALVARFAA